MFYLSKHSSSLTSLLRVLQVQTTTMCISVSLSGFVVLGCMFAPKVHIIMFQPQKNVTNHRLNLNRFSVSGAATTYASHGGFLAATCSSAAFLKLSLRRRKHRIPLWRAINLAEERRNRAVCSSCVVLCARTKADRNMSFCKCYIYGYAWLAGYWGCKEADKAAALNSTSSMT